MNNFAANVNVIGETAVLLVDLRGEFVSVSNDKGVDLGV